MAPNFTHPRQNPPIHQVRACRAPPFFKYSKHPFFLSSLLPIHQGGAPPLLTHLNGGCLLTSSGIYFMLGRPRNLPCVEVNVRVDLLIAFLQLFDTCWPPKLQTWTTKRAIVASNIDPKMKRQETWKIIRKLRKYYMKAKCLNLENDAPV